MIDVHIHAVPPNLPGTGSLAPILRDSPEAVASAIRREMQVAKVRASSPWVPGTRAITIPSAWRPPSPSRHRCPACSPSASRTRPAPMREHFRRVESVLATGRVAALKCYLGYLHYEPSHPNYRRYFELAAQHKLPVIFHTGDTYSPNAKLKYAHPLGVDDVAVDHPEVRFVMCHLGNPWTVDAARGGLQEHQRLGRSLGDAGRQRAVLRRPRRGATRPRTWALRSSKRSATPSVRTASCTAPTGRSRRCCPMPTSCARSIPPQFHEAVFEENARLLFRV